MRLFSTLDDGAGYSPAEDILDAWTVDGIESGADILQALNFDLDGKLSLTDLTAALENELLVAKNGIHRAALASFKAEIRHLLECVDQEVREKEKIRSDLEKAEKQKTQLAAEVDERHSAIEHTNSLNLRKLEQDHRERLAAVRSELTKEMDQIRQQAGLQREQLEAEVAKVREDECFLRDHLSISVKENRRLEMELLDGAEKLAEAQTQISKLQTSLDNITKEKFGDLDPGSADFFLQEERIKQLRSGYEAQCRELQDRIDELQSELREVHALGRAPDVCPKALSEELESKSPGMESDPGIGSEEVQPFSMSLEAEMMLERLKEQHLQEVEDLRSRLASKIDEEQHRQEVQALREEVAGIQSHAQELQDQLEEAVLERTRLEQKQAEEAGKVVEELRSQLKEEHEEVLEARLAEQREELEALERRLLDDWERQKTALEDGYEEKLRAKLEEVKSGFEEQREELVKTLNDAWQKEKEVLDEQNNESLQLLLEEEMLRLVKEQEEKERSMREQWERERAQLQEHQEEEALHRLLQEREQHQQREEKLKEEWEKERLQLEEDYEGMIRDRLEEEREKLREEERRMEEQMEEERGRLQEIHREAVKELRAKHGEEREALAAALDKLRDDVTQEREEVELSFAQRLRQAEDRFSRQQESAAERFQADVSALERRHQSELETLRESHGAQTLLWESELRKTAEEARRTMEEEREGLSREWEEERRELGSVHEKEVEVLEVEKQQLQEELEKATGDAQRKEIDLSMQLNELHGRLQEQRELLAEAEAGALLLSRSAEGFQRERAELLGCISELHATSESQDAERERLRVKVEELETEVRRLKEPEETVSGGDGAEDASEVVHVADVCLDRGDGEGGARDVSPEEGREDELEHVGCLRGQDDAPTSSETLLELLEAVEQTGDPEWSRSPTNREAEAGSESKLKSLYATATEENLLLHEKVSLLQQKTEILENLLSHHGDKLRSGRRALEENYGLKVQMLLLMEHVGELEAKAVDAAELRIRHEDCVCENAKLKEQNGELERRVWSLEGRIGVFQDVQGEHASLVDEICRMREDNAELFRLLSDEEKTERLPDDDDEEEEEEALEDCCRKFEEQNSELRRAIAELQDESQTLDEKTRAHRSETSRLAEENVLLRQKISTLKEADMRGVQEELTQTLDRLKTEKFAAQQSEDDFKKQISELRLLEDENGTPPTENNAVADMPSLRRENRRREAFPAEERSKVKPGGRRRARCDGVGLTERCCASALEAELTTPLEDAAQLQDRSGELSQELHQLREKAITMETQLNRLLEERQDVDKETAGLYGQLAKAQEKAKTAEESLQAAGRQSSRLKTELRVLQQERESLRHDVAVLQKQLQNASNKNQLLELALHSSGLQNQSKKLQREEAASRLVEQLRQDNERLQAELRSTRSDLVQSREKVRQLDASLLSLNKQRPQGQLSLVKALEQENAALKQELHAKAERAEGSGAGRSCPEVESLQQENEALKAQMARLSSQLLETFQAQLVGLLPPSPHRVPRHRGDDPDNMQGAMPDQRAAHADSYRRIGGL